MRQRRLWRSVFALLVTVLLGSFVLAQDTEIDPDLVRPVLEHPFQDEILYFVMPDRFFDGNPDNNCGDYDGPCVIGDSEENVLTHGYLPTDKGYYHGGDIAGLMSQLDYLTEMGVTAIWAGPIFKNKPVQPDSSNLYGYSSAYHGYWITDFTTVDPHLGTDDEFAALVAGAHDRDVSVFMDIITNHTADVIQLEGGDGRYRGKDEFPYRDASGDTFDDSALAYGGQDDYSFPELDLDTSFPYRPVVPEAEVGVKTPEWLNDPSLYHNRGNTTFSGENSLYGDFFGLDDLFTERREVVDGMVDIYSQWIVDYQIDGFRIDTTKHVNLEFWQVFGPAMMEAANEAGVPGFFAFGEVYDQNYGPVFLSEFSTDGQLQSTIDFAFQVAARAFASQGAATDDLRAFFEGDDYYTDADSNAYAMPTFLGNHDMGRIGHFLQQDQSDASDDELLARSQLAHALMFFARGQPVIYYGDEQGFTGDGGDKDARENMFPSLVEVYNDNDLIGTDATTAEDNFDQSHPIYRALASYAGLYREHDALRRGAQIHRYSTDTPGVYAFSRIGRDEQVEYVVAFNNSTDTATASVPTFYASGTNFDLLYGADGQDASLVTGDDGSLDLSLPALSFAIYRAQAPLSASEAAPGITISSLEDGQEVSLAYQPQNGHLVLERIEVRAELERDVFAEVNFAVSVDGGAFAYIGTDNNAPYRVLYDPGQHLGSELSFMAIANDLNGNLSSALVSGVTVNVDEPTGPETDYPFAVIHYRRPAGDYGQSTAATEDDWGVHTWGEAITPGQGENVWSDPIPFRGETEFGRFAYFALSDGSSPLNFIVHTPSGDNIPLTREPGGDRSFIPDETPQVWLVQGDETVYTSQAAAQGFVTVHYLSDGEADVSFDVMAGEMMMGEGLEPTTTSDTGATLTVDLPEDLDLGTPLTVTVRAQGETLSEASFTPSQQATAWLTSGSDVAYASRAAARNVALIHYYRPDGDYGDYDSDDYNDFWGLHVWTGAASPTDWTAPIEPSGQDAFGVYFEVPLAEDATELAYIIHRGDAKDPGPDQFLSLTDTGFEVWQPSGANAEAAYVVPPVTLSEAE